ncbi:MAG: histidinol-phosphate transaminase [Armatimonadetes bacterium]|nr:histidinol-phosphate transaminase [Armatimonadota bacterium]
MIGTKERVQPEANFLRLINKGIHNLNRYLPGKPIEEVERELGLGEVIKMASNENPLGPSPRAIAAISGYLTRSHLYPDDNAYYLTNALATRLGIEPNRLILGNGAVEIIKMSAQTLLSPADEVVLASPSFAIYREDVKQMAAKCVEIPLRPDFTYDTDGMATAVTGRTKMLVVVSPNNPTGTIIPQQDLDNLLNRVPPRVLVILDEAYRDYVDDVSYPDGLSYAAKYPNLLLLRTFSKAYGLAGVRVGYGVGNQELVGYMNRVRVLFNVNALAQVAALAALEDEDHVKASIACNREGKRYLYGELNRLGLPYVSTQSNFIAINTQRDDQEVFQDLMRLGIIVRPCKGFGMPGYIRVTVGTAPQNERFLSALAQVLEKLPARRHS